jgi:hypothetical protein
LGLSFYLYARRRPGAGACIGRSCPRICMPAMVASKKEDVGRSQEK